MSRYGSAIVTALQQSLRPVTLAGLSPEKLIDDLWLFLQTTSAGATAMGADIDSLCLGGGAFGYDNSLAVSDGLNFRFKAGRVQVGNAVKTIAAGTILLTASATNYVEVDGSGGGAVTSNTSGWTTGKAPLYIVTTGVSAIATVTNAKVLIEAPTPAAIVGAMLSAAAATKLVEEKTDTVSATTTFEILSPGVAATLSGALFSNSTAFATDNTNYWSFRLQNLGPAGTGTTDMLNTGAVNTTQTTGGSALTAHVARSLTLNGTPANLVTAANDVLLLTITKTGAPANLTLSKLRLDFSFTG